VVTYVDAEAAVAAWVNTQTGTLVGEGRPLSKGAHLHELRGAATACYARLSVVGGAATLNAENPDHRARISASIFGPTKEAAAAAAVAYANALRGLDGRPATMGAATGLVADAVVGPLWAPDGAGPRYLVDADFYLRAA